MSDDNPLAINHEPWDPDHQRRSRIRWLLASVGMAFLLLLASCVGCFVVGRRGSAQGANFAADVVQSLTDSWDADVLIDSASPELMETSSPEKTRDFISFVADRLGQREKCEDVQSDQWTVQVGTTGLAVISLHYIDCEFAGGRARITLRVRKHGERWQVISINVNSEVLLTPGAPGRVPEVLRG